MNKRGMVFGVFDGLHEGHKYFLTEAAKHCDELIIVVTLPHIVEQIKKQTPKYTFNDRMQAIADFQPQTKVIAGDSILGDWIILKTHKPDLVIIGYDQDGIAREMKRMNIPHVFIQPFYPEKYKSGLLNKK